ncbi:MAG TPA: response regulator, partial [Thermoguttaceae bacterium]|nr:response regulator [Thermoguttaceae bacterium]
MVKTHLRVLLVEDDFDHAEFIKRALEGAGLTTFELEHVESLAAAKAALETNDFEAVLLDLGLPDASGFEALREVRSQSPDVPIVVLTSNSDPSAGVEAAEHGAQDYMFKGEITLHTLERILRYAVGRQEMYLQLHRANKLLDQKNAEMQDANRLLDQKNIRLAQLYETAQQFVDNVSHEFRTPLTVIKEFVTLTRDGLGGAVTRQQCEFLDIANDRVDDLAIMVDDMLDVSKLEAGVLSVWRRKSRIEDIVAHVCQPLQRKAAIKNVALDVVLGDDLPIVFCDPEKVSRVVINLVTNAIKFCGDGGRVTLLARPGTDGSEVIVEISDNGPGIAKEDVKLIFDRFRQVENAARSSQKGFGLGLGIAKELVHLNLGTIGIASELGRGSTFSFSVPVFDPAEVIDRYLHRLQQIDHCVPYATLLVARISSPTENEHSTVESLGLESANQADEFLQHIFRGSDLIVPIEDDKWMVLARCHQNEVDAMLQRVRTAWAEANDNRPTGRLPHITFEAKGTWCVETDLEELRQRLRSELTVRVEDRHVPRVLIVDDDREMLCGLDIRLTANGFEVLTATNGKTAIDSAIKNHPDAILMDNYM